MSCHQHLQCSVIYNLIFFRKIDKQKTFDISKDILTTNWVHPHNFKSLHVGFTLPRGGPPSRDVSGCTFVQLEGRGKFPTPIYPDSRQCSDMLSSSIHSLGCVRKNIQREINADGVKVNTSLIMTREWTIHQNRFWIKFKESCACLNNE